MTAGDFIKCKFKFTLTCISRLDLSNRRVSCYQIYPDHRTTASRFEPIVPLGPWKWTTITIVQFIHSHFGWASSGHLLMFPFGEKIDPCRGNTFSSVPPSNSLVSVLDPWRAFWADTPPFKGPRLASCVASGTTEMQGHCQVCCARRGGPRTPSKTADANLDSDFVENALFYTNPWLWKVNII